MTAELPDPAEQTLTPLLNNGFGGTVEETAQLETVLAVEPPELAAVVESILADGGRLVGVLAVAVPEPAIVALVAFRGDLVSIKARLGSARSYPAVSVISPAALLPERELHDRTGITPAGHPHLGPLLHPDADQLTRQVVGPETFVIPYGPIRSGVFETVQYVIDTGGEDVLAVGVRPFFKHRGLERRFEGLTLQHGVFLAERVTGPAAVAHATAFVEAVERATGTEAPLRAHRWRMVHAELERIAAHLDVATRLAEDCALAVGVARFGILKERVMRLRARLSGSRFGRGAIAVGGLTSEPLCKPSELLQELERFEREYLRDRRLLLRTTSFTDRLIGSGTLDRALVDLWGGVGPVARACSTGIDCRLERPYGSYSRLGFRLSSAIAGDAMARLDVRLQEIDESVHLIRQGLERLDRTPDEITAHVETQDGVACGWAEAPMGEVVYRVAVRDGRIAECRIVSPTLRNWPLFAKSFRGDVLTDFSFIEHSFGATPAGADR